MRHEAFSRLLDRAGNGRRVLMDSRLCMQRVEWLYRGLIERLERKFFEM